jgi:hypothetical protein
MEKIDVVILSDLNTQKEVTEWTIQTLRDSEISYLSHCKYNVNVVSKTTDVQISNTNVICVDEPFNYNRFLNIGFQHLTDAEWVLISNNDVSYERDWLLEILHIHKMRPDIHSFSPRDPLLFMKYFPNVFVGTNYLYVESYVVTLAFQGWCILIRRESLDKILPLDENFDMYYQDNDFAEMLKKFNIKHALCRHSIASHLSTLNISQLSYEKQAKMMEDETKFRAKWNIF